MEFLDKTNKPTRRRLVVNKIIRHSTYYYTNNYIIMSDSFDPSKIIESVSTAFEDGLQAASKALKQSTATAKDEATKAAGVLQIGYDHIIYGLEMVDAMVISTLKDGIMFGLENQVATSAGLVGVTVVAVPVLRRAVWRATLGRFSNPDRMAEAYESNITSMIGQLETQKGEITKLSERLTFAQEEYARGLAKLRDAASEMRSLESRVQKSEKHSKDLLYNIRSLRAKQALQLRSDAAVVVEAAKRQRHQVEKIVNKLDTHGL